MSTCDRIEELRDYAFDELPATESLDAHIKSCTECATELDRLRLTTAALRALPDREIPQRIAFVSDKVFEPGWLSRWWNSGAKLGFASACVLTAGLVISAYHRPATVSPQRSMLTVADVQKQIDDAVQKAVSEVRESDAKTLNAALEASERKHDREYRALMVAVQENMEILQKRLSTNYLTMLTSGEGGR